MHTLGEMQVYTAQALNELNARGDKLRSALNALSARHGSKLQWTGHGSMMMPHFMHGELHSFTQATKADPRLKWVAPFCDLCLMLGLCDMCRNSSHWHGSSCAFKCCKSAVCMRCLLCRIAHVLLFHGQVMALQAAVVHGSEQEGHLDKPKLHDQP